MNLPTTYPMSSFCDVLLNTMSGFQTSVYEILCAKPYALKLCTYVGVTNGML